MPRITWPRAMNLIFLLVLIVGVAVAVILTVALTAKSTASPTAPVTTTTVKPVGTTAITVTNPPPADFQAVVTLALYTGPDSDDSNSAVPQGRFKRAAQTCTFESNQQQALSTLKQLSDFAVVFNIITFTDVAVSQENKNLKQAQDIVTGTKVDFAAAGKMCQKNATNVYAGLQEKYKNNQPSLVYFAPCRAIVNPNENDPCNQNIFENADKVVIVSSSKDSAAINNAYKLGTNTTITSVGSENTNIPETITKTIGVLVIVMNVPIIGIIMLKKKNRIRKELVFIAGMAFGDIIYASGMFFSSTRRLEFYSNATLEEFTVPRIQCVEQAAPILLFVGNILLGQMNLVNAIDRFLATTFPIWYFKKSIRYTALLLTIGYLVSFIILIGNIILVSSNKDIADAQVSVLCALGDSSYPGARDTLTFLRMFCILLSAVLYAVVAYMLRKRFSPRAKDVPQLSRQNSKKLLRSNLTMGMTMVNAVVFLLIPDLLLQFVVETSSTNIRMFLYCVILFKTVVNFFIFVLRHKELRGIIMGNASSQINPTI